MIFTTPQLLPDCLHVIDEVAGIRAKLKYALTTPSRWVGLLRRSTFARAIRGSNSIEGYNVTTDDAIAAVEGEEPLDAERETWAAISGYRNALTFVLQLANDPHFEYSEGFIRSLHYMMLSYDLAKHPGNWRPGPIYVRDEGRKETVYEGPGADDVPGLMRELVDSLNGDDGFPAVVRAAMGHLNLALIHPFSDGNGRMARCLQTLVLAREGILDPAFCSIEEYLGRNTTEYYAVLAEVGQGSWQPQNNARPWIRFCLNAHYNQAATLLRRARELDRVWSELEDLIKSLGLPERAIYALSDATFGYRVRNATYRSVAEVSETVASRDFKAMVESGLLAPAGEKRGRVYAASPVLKNLRERTREPQPAYKPILPELPSRLR